MNERSFAAQLAEDLGPEDVRLILGVFEKDLGRLSGVLAEAAAAGDGAAFRRAAHGLAGAAGAVGAAALERACRAGMARAPGAGPAELAETLEAVRVAAAQTLADMAAFLRGLGPAA